MKIVAGLFLYDTCVQKCSYCHFAETGKVLDTDQLKPFREKKFIDILAHFFNSRKVDFEISLTGGEPLIMPNFGYFVDQVAQRNNKISVYTSLMIAEKNKNFQELLKNADKFEFLMCSYHPEASKDKGNYFLRLKALKEAGHSVIVRFVSHPLRMEELEILKQECDELDISFYPTPLFSENYPENYTEKERDKLMSFFKTKSQYIMLSKGINTSDVKCTAGKNYIQIDLRSGSISPCASLREPILGNIYENRLELVEEKRGCFKPGTDCICDLHFFNDVIEGFEDSENYFRLKQGAKSQKEILWDKTSSHKVDSVRIGQTNDGEVLLFNKANVASSFQKNKTYFQNEYRNEWHSTFLRFLEKNNTKYKV
jgi:MoaA/NifB/PqqE/SkfB family radical SAM enzyme